MTLYPGDWAEILVKLSDDGGRLQNSLVFLAAVLQLFPRCATFFLSFFHAVLHLFMGVKNPPWEPLFVSNSSASLCESEWLFSCAHSPRAWLVAHSTTLDPPHYGQQIAALTETRFKGSACRLLCLDKHTCQSGVLGYESVMGLWYHGPLRQRTAACLLLFTCAETKHMAPVFSDCNDQQGNFWVFVRRFPSLPDPSSSHTSSLIDTFYLFKKIKWMLNWNVASVVDAHPLWGSAWVRRRQRSGRFWRFSWMSCRVSHSDGLAGV